MLTHPVRCATTHRGKQDRRGPPEPEWNVMQYSLTELQLAIMHVLWARGEATILDIHDDLRAQRRIAQSTIATLIARMREREIVDHRVEDRQYIYRARVSEEQVRRSVVHEFSELTGRLFSGNVAGLVSQLISARDVQPDDLARAREIIEQKERELRERGEGS